MKQMKELYVKPALEITEFDTEDVITTSDGDTNSSELIEGGDED